MQDWNWTDEIKVHQGAEILKIHASRCHFHFLADLASGSLIKKNEMDIATEIFVAFERLFRNLRYAKWFKGNSESIPAPLDFLVTASVYRESARLSASFRLVCINSFSIDTLHHRPLS